MQDAVRIGFDFLDAGDGGVIEVIHQENAAPAVRGTIRGASIGTGAKRITLTPAVID
jgi:hypothetical protein